jgi:hypothetical protein
MEASMIIAHCTHRLPAEYEFLYLAGPLLDTLACGTQGGR